MQKTDAELIAIAERWEAMTPNYERSPLGEGYIELARRLKAANEIIAAAEWKGPRPRPLSEAERQEFGSDD